MTQNRQPAGIPVGGQFAPGAQARSDVALDLDESSDANGAKILSPNPSAKTIGTRASTPEPTDPTAEPTGLRGVWCIADVYAHHPGGNPSLRARYTTAAEVLREMEDAEEVEAILDSLARMRSTMTALVTHESGSVRAIELRGETDRDGRRCGFRKGGNSQRFLLTGPGSLDIVAVLPSYGGQESLAQGYHDALAKVPDTAEATFDDLPSSDGHEHPSEIAAVYMVDGPDTDAVRVPGCLFLATDIQREDGIVNGYFWAPANSGLPSEYGSMYVDDIRQNGGRLEGYEPGALTFRDCLNGALPPSRFEAYRCIQGQSYYDE